MLEIFSFLLYNKYSLQYLFNSTYDLYHVKVISIINLREGVTASSSGTAVTVYPDTGISLGSRGGSSDGPVEVEAVEAGPVGSRGGELV